MVQKIKLDLVLEMLCHVSATDLTDGVSYLLKLKHCKLSRFIWSFRERGSWKQSWSFRYEHVKNMI